MPQGSMVLARDDWQLAVAGFQGGDPGRHGACAVRVVCNPFRVGARVGEVPVTALRLPPAIFCQPCRLRQRVPAFRLRAHARARNRNKGTLYFSRERGTKRGHLPVSFIASEILM
jgi:hypothetical protein